jgi:hypothetical protein
MHGALKGPDMIVIYAQPLRLAMWPLEAIGERGPCHTGDDEDIHPADGAGATDTAPRHALGHRSVEATQVHAKMVDRIRVPNLGMSS